MEPPNVTVVYILITISKVIYNPCDYRSTNKPACRVELEGGRYSSTAARYIQHILLKEKTDHCNRARQIWDRTNSTFSYSICSHSLLLHEKQERAERNIFKFNSASVSCGPTFKTRTANRKSTTNARARRLANPFPTSFFVLFHSLLLFCCLLASESRAVVVVQQRIY